MRNCTRQLGATAWEVLVLLALVGGLAVGGWYLLGHGSAADQHRLTVERMERVMEALNKYALDNGGRFPTAEQGLAALVAKPTQGPVPGAWRGPYLAKGADRFDAWGRELHYITPGGGASPRPFDLWSLGADNREGGAGAAADLNSWQPETFLPPRN